jgi:hypothetical protein
MLAPPVITLFAKKAWHKGRVGQSGIYTPYMTEYLVIFLPK